MIVNYPLRLTGSGISGHNTPNTVTVMYLNGTSVSNVGVIDSSILIGPFTMNKSSGYDASGNRITNIVGFDGSELLKRCPSCGNDKRTTDFGPQGRVTTSKRDQSECISCRSGY